MKQVRVEILSAASPINGEELREWAEFDDECGAVVTFAGIVRQTENGHIISALDYEQHQEMALPEMKRVVERALAQFSIERAACVHRVGSVAVGEASIFIAVGAAHRDAAFAACRFIIDEVKKTVPLWKSPVFMNSEVQPESADVDHKY